MVQLQVLNKILKNKDSSIIVLNNLNADYFSSYKSEFLFIQNHLNQYNQVPDIETFVDKFPEFDIVDVQESDSFLIEELTKDYNTRYLANSFNNIRDLLMANKVDEAMQAYKNSYENMKTGVSLQSIDITKDTSRYDAYVERLDDFNKYYITTGFKELDQIIGGWDREEELATIVARTNMAKSWVLLKCASAAVKKGLKVGLYSGEMSERKVGYRFDTLVGHVANGSLIHGNVNVQNDYKKYIDDLPNMFKDGSLKVLTPKMINGPAGVSALRAFVEKEQLDILFIDQHSLLEDDRKARNPVEKAANISKDLKNLQVMCRIPIISVSQQNRTSTENGVNTTMIAQSDRIGQDSTLILFLEKKEEMLKMHIVKSRDSENGKVLTYKTDLNNGYFYFVPEGDEDLQEAEEEYEHRYERTETNDEEVVF